MPIVSIVETFASQIFFFRFVYLVGFILYKEVIFLLVT